MSTPTLFLFYFTCILINFGIKAQTIAPEPIKRHIFYLASDELKGRGTSSPGAEKAATYIAEQFSKAGLQAFNNNYLKAFTYKKSQNPHDTAMTGAKEEKSANVVGFLDNRAPFTIVIGGHYDHLGLGYDHNSLDANPEGKIHHGADDNASGTAGVIALADYFSHNNITEPYNFLFICFSGEELGLLGSKKWCEDPDLPLDKIDYMINMDMIGRLNDSTRKLIIYGVGTSPAFVPLIDSVRSSFSIKKDSSGVGPSDQTSFYLKGIPVLHFFTGQHSDYHKPLDQANKINYKGEADVLNYIATLIERTFHYPKLSFAKTRNADMGKTSFKVTIGVMPDYAFEGDGMRIDGVSDNRPAARAGIQTGDVVKKLGGMEVKNVEGYMKALSQFKKGDSTQIEILRKTEVLILNLTF